MASSSRRMCVNALVAIWWTGAGLARWARERRRERERRPRASVGSITPSSQRCAVAK
jgi:hypothetical protein